MQWQSIRHMHISTGFENSPSRSPESQIWLPECSLRWDTCCRVLSEIPDLDSLRLDIIIVTVHLNPDSTVLEALCPLKRIQAKLFEVELNVGLSSHVRYHLGAVNFAVFVRERPYNTKLYGTSQSLFMYL